jgi:hypothetical protein
MSTSSFHQPDPDRSEIQARPSQSYVDAVGHYRNLAISLGATPEQMLNTFDRDLCHNGLDFERGDYTVDDACGDLAEVWDEVDCLQAEVAQYERFFRSRMVGHLVACTEGNGCQCGINDLPLWGKEMVQ